MKETVLGLDDGEACISRRILPISDATLTPLWGDILQHRGRCRCEDDRQGYTNYYKLQEL